MQSVQTFTATDSVSVFGETFLQKGYVLHGPFTQVQGPLESSSGSSVPNEALGGAWSKGNVSRSLINLENVGTLIGSGPVPEDNPVVYNDLRTLLPGLYPPVSGPWTSTQERYDLDAILAYVNADTNRYFTKVLGLGLGSCLRLPVSDVSRNACSTLATSFVFNPDDEGFSGLTFGGLKQVAWQNYINGYVSPDTLTGVNFYMNGLDWATVFGVDQIHGTNAFPFLGWAGARVGSLQPVSFQFQQNALYNFPSGLLQLSTGYNPVGIVYAGQGTQYNAYSEIQPPQRTFESRSARTYQDPLTNRQNLVTQLGVVPYQEGRGVFDYFSNEVQYNELNGLVDYVESPSTVAPEGAQPGRNVAFAGVALTDYWSRNIKPGTSSLTPQDTRLDTRPFPQRNPPGLRGRADPGSFPRGDAQTKAAHNAPLSYLPQTGTGTGPVLPWNSLWGYVGATTSSSSNTRSENVPCLTEGLTTMVVSGAYPLYRAAWNAQASFADPTFIQGQGLDQYYFTKDFWNPDFLDPSTPEIDALGQNPPVPPNPPFRTKGGRIVLYQGQRIKAGSFIYANMNTVGNVPMPQFYAPASKDSVDNGAFESQVPGDLYAKYQANQGGIIVIVSVDGQPPPPPPPCAQPIGVVLEDLAGFGSPETDDGVPVTGFQTTQNVASQNCNDFSSVNQLQGRELLVKIFPLYAQFYLSGVSPQTALFFNFPLMVGVDIFDPGSETYTNLRPVVFRVKTNYMLMNGVFDLFSTFAFPGTGDALRNKEFITDWPGPTSGLLRNQAQNQFKNLCA